MTRGGKMEYFYEAGREEGLTDGEIRLALLRSLEGKTPKKALLVPPDYTRFHSGAGRIANLYYHMLEERGCRTDVLPALGSHAPMTKTEAAEMFGDIPFERFLAHNWREGVVRLGEVPGERIAEWTGGLWAEPVGVEISRRVMDPAYELILSIGQVVPHEVTGMANHAKNLFIGLGGSEIINKSHMIGAVCGIEQAMGRDHTPARELLDYALARFLKERPVVFVLTVTTVPGGETRTHGLFIGDTRKVLEQAIRLSRKKNVTFLDGGVKKCVVYLPPKEFHSTWLGNKAIYRTRMAIADGGELLVLAPGIERFGEDAQIDALIRKYGYRGRLRVLEDFQKNADLRENMAAAAHLIHGSSDGRFRITYAVKNIPETEIEGVGFAAARYGEQAARYDPGRLHDGFNTLPDGEEIYFISNPALGLWIDRERFQGEL